MNKFFMNFKQKRNPFLDKVEAEIKERTNFNVDSLMTCFGLILSKNHPDMTTEEILKDLSGIDAMMTPLISGEKTVQDYVEELKERTGILIKC